MSQQMQSTRQIPAAIQQLAEIHRPGTLMTTYKTSKDFKPLYVAFWITFGIGIFSAFFACPTIGATWAGDIANAGPASTELVIWLAGLLILGVIVYIVAKGRRARHRDDLLAVYSEGFIPLNGDKAQVFRWEQIAAVWRGSEKSSEQGGGIDDIDFMRLQKTDGTEFKIDMSFDKHFRAYICDTIEREFLHARLPGAIADYREGRFITFGDLNINRQGVRDITEMLAWNQVERFEVGPEYVTIRKEGRTSEWYRRIISSVPNACLLRELLISVGLVRW